MESLVNFGVLRKCCFISIQKKYCCREGIYVSWEG